jgi:hypothetical protein
VVQLETIIISSVETPYLEPHFIMAQTTSKPPIRIIGITKEKKPLQASSVL